VSEGTEKKGTSPVPPADAECAKCGAKATERPLQPDPEIEEVWFCAPCWEERVRVTATHEYGYDNDFMEE
jgi:hypothetical protein